MTQLDSILKLVQTLLTFLVFRWISLTSSTIGITEAASARAVIYSVKLIEVKPKASRKNGIYMTAAVRINESSIEPKRYKLRFLMPKIDL